MCLLELIFLDENTLQRGILDRMSKSINWMCSLLYYSYNVRSLLHHTLTFISSLQCMNHPNPWDSPSCILGVKPPPSLVKISPLWTWLVYTGILQVYSHIQMIQVLQLIYGKHKEANSLIYTKIYRNLSKRRLVYNQYTVGIQSWNWIQVHVYSA